MLQTFKILNRYDDVDYRTWFKKVDELHQMTRQAVVVSEDGTVLGKPISNLERYGNSFSAAAWLMVGTIFQTM